MARHNQGMGVGTPCGRYKGRLYYRVPVELVYTNTHSRTLDRFSRRMVVIAPTAAAAADWAKDWLLDQGMDEPFEVFAVGPRGGVQTRFTGWEGIIMWRMVHRWRAPDAGQSDWLKSSTAETAAAA